MNELNDIEKVQEWFRHQSISVWRRILFSWQQESNTRETTITENLVFEFWQFAKFGKGVVSLYEFKKEHVRGNDLELMIETPKGYLLFPCQCKMISKQSKYPTIAHKVGKHYQVDLLVDYAKKHGGLPLYMFYNHSLSLSQQMEQYESIISEEEYGISVLGAVYVKYTFFKEDRKPKW